jgi:hypothetical protein
MKIRYCETTISQSLPCQVGWGSAGTDGVKSCHDEPMEENCRHIRNYHLSCPICGTALTEKWYCNMCKSTFEDFFTWIFG